VCSRSPCTERGQHGYVVVVHRENQGARSESRSAQVIADPQAVGQKAKPR
jgi:hypothetical protein